jgi:hypothetical protein
LRKSVLIAVIALAAALAVGITIYAITRPAAVSSDDPLASQSYANGEYSQSLLENASSTVDSALTPIYDAALGAAQSAKPAADTTARHIVSSSGTVDIGEGSSIVMASGEAAIAISAGTVSDVTDGAAAASGSMVCGHRYIVCTGGSARITASKRCVFITSGGAKVSAGEIKSPGFSDVSASAWYYDDVSYAVSLGLISGTSAKTFAPAGTLTLAQTIKLAACIHQYDADGKVTLKPDADIWYMSYVEYAVSENIVEGSYAGKSSKDYSAPVTRQEFVHIFHGALPSDKLTEINSVADGAIPDVKASAKYSADIYDFYRAGILVGGKGNAFSPEATVTRSEAAAITARMMDTTLRQSVTLK